MNCPSSAPCQYPIFNKPHNKKLSQRQCHIQPIGSSDGLGNAFHRSFCTLSRADPPFCCLFSLALSLWHSLHLQCLPPCEGPWLGSFGKSSKGFHVSHVEQTFPFTPFLSMMAMLSSSLFVCILEAQQLIGCLSNLRLKIVNKGCTREQEIPCICTGKIWLVKHCVTNPTFVARVPV